MAAIFLAKCVGIDLTLGQMVMIVITATLASIGTAGTSGAGMIMLAMVLEAVGVPTTFIGIIYGIDRLFDMGRTTLNIIGDASCAVCVNAWEGASRRHKLSKDLNIIKHSEKKQGFFRSPAVFPYPVILRQAPAQDRFRAAHRAGIRSSSHLPERS